MRWWSWGVPFVAAMLLAEPAMAEGFYVSAAAGPYRQNDLRYDFVTLNNLFLTTYKDGFEVMVKGGYDFEGIRVEGEVAHKKAQISTFGFSLDGEEFVNPSGPAVAGNLNSISGVVNVAWDITQGPVRPYVGVGVGLVRTASDDVGFADFGDAGIFLDATDLSVVYRGMAGVSAKLNNHVSANAEYRFSTVQNFELKVFGSSAKARAHSSSLLVGLTYYFGGQHRRSPPEPLPALPLPPPPPPPVETSYVVQFEHTQPGITIRMREILDQAVVAYNQAGYASVMITGDAAVTGPAPYDDALALRRGEMIRRELVGRGVPAQVISVQSFTLPSPYAGTSEERIYISFGPGSGQ